MIRRLGHLRGRRRARGRRWRWWVGLCQLDLLFRLWFRLRLRLRFWLRFWLWFRLRRLRLFLDLVRQDQLLFLLWGRGRRRRRRRWRWWSDGRRRWRRRRRRWSRRLRLLRRRLVRAPFLRNNAPDRSEDLLHRRFLGRFSVVHNLVPGGATPGVQTSMAPSTRPILASSGATPVILATSVGFLKERVSRDRVEIRPARSRRYSTLDPVPMNLFRTLS